MFCNLVMCRHVYRKNKIHKIILSAKICETAYNENMLLTGVLYKFKRQMQFYSNGNFIWSFKKNDLMIILGIEKHNLCMFYIIYSITENSLCFCKDYRHVTGTNLESAITRV